MKIIENHMSTRGLTLPKILMVFTIALATLSSIGFAFAQAEKTKNPIAQFSGIDKITGKIIKFDVYMDETVQFGALQITPRVCYSRADNEAPGSNTFVEVEEITLDRKIQRIFTGWMFADSPGLNAVEHAVYDVWLASCKSESDVPAPES